jgi:hypothetical protein
MQIWDLNDFEQYQKELIEQARRDHLAHEILSQRREHMPALAWVGQRIAEIGLKLTSRPHDEQPSDVSLN